MTLTSPALQAAKDKLEARRAARSFLHPGQPTATNRHAELRMAYSTAGINDHCTTLYFRVQYCPNCLRGTAIELVQQQPVGLPSAQETGIKRARNWPLECPAAR